MAVGLEIYNKVGLLFLWTDLEFKESNAMPASTRKVQKA